MESKIIEEYTPLYIYSVFSLTQTNFIFIYVVREKGK